MADQRRISFSIDEGSWPGGPPAALQAAAAQGEIVLDLDLALLGVGVLTRPPQATGFSLSDCWAWLRYYAAFNPGPMLRLRPEWTELDPHHKTVASDDFGVGLGTRVLADLLGLTRYGDTLWVLKVLQLGQWRLGGQPRRGPRKSPDYIAYDRAGAVSVVECKGSQTSWTGLEGSMERGIVQKANLHALGAQRPIHELVVGAFVPQFEKRDHALIRVIDPSKDDSRRELTKFSEAAIRRAIETVDLATEYAAFNFGSTAAAIMEGRPEVPMEEVLISDLARDPARADGAPTIQQDLLWAEPVMRGEHLFRGIRYSARMPERAVDPVWAREELGRRREEDPLDLVEAVWTTRPSENGAVLISPLGSTYQVEWLE